MTNAYDYSFTSIDGKPMPLSQFKGHPVLVVNTASRCGLTPQYEGLEKLYTDYKDKGLVVLGVPCNQFMGQEPGTEEEIKDFCETKFNVDFPMTSKNDVKGDSRHPFYAWAEEKLGEGAVPVRNFHKILIGPDGEAVQAFGPRTEPLDDSIKGAVEAAL
jgi:glutathione peroxidase